MFEVRLLMGLWAWLALMMMRRSFGRRSGEELIRVVITVLLAARNFTVSFCIYFFWFWIVIGFS